MKNRRKCLSGLISAILAMTSTNATAGRSGAFQDCARCPKMRNVPALARHSADGKTTVAVSITPVTFAEWNSCARNGGCEQYYPDRQGWSLNAPVVNVSYDDAQSYLRWLQKISGKRYRLPLEDEWANISLGGKTTRYPWGDQLGRGKTNCLECGSKWDSRKASPVRSFRPNAYGLYDTTGNVAHWTQSGDLPQERNCKSKPDYASIYGASWADPAKFLVTSDWACFPRHLRDDTIGFRVVREE
jgi:formylglycine-generating enzyme required for sulfatase activity